MTTRALRTAEPRRRIPATAKSVALHAGGDGRRVRLELVELRVHEPALEGRHDDQVRHAERARHDREQREREPEPDARITPELTGRGSGSRRRAR